MKGLFNKLLIIVSTVCVFYSSNGQSFVSKEKKSEILLTELIERLSEKDYSVFFLDTLKITQCAIFVNEDSLSIPYLEKRINEQTEFYLIAQERNEIFIVNKRDVTIDLESFFFNRLEGENSVTETYENSLQKKYHTGLLGVEKQIIVFGDRKNKEKGDVTISGYIKDVNSGEAIIGATFYIPELNKGMASNEIGYFRVVLPAGKYNVEIRSIGMTPINGNLVVYGEDSKQILMNKAVHSLSEVSVSADKDYQIRGSEIGLDKISIKQVQKMPSLLGERDIIKVSQMLPGVVKVSEGSSGINVRGGNADQNAYYINDIPIFNSNHALGFFSSINSSTIKDFEMYKGYIPIEYSGRLSSVFNISTRRGNKKQFFAQGSISPISTSLNLEGPIIKDKLSYVASGRYAYPNWILKKFDDENVKRSELQFNDYTFSLDYQPNVRSRLNAFYYSSFDRFDYFMSNELSYSNKVAGLQYVNQLSDRLNLIALGSFSNYNFENVEKINPSSAFDHQFYLIQNRINIKMRWLQSSKLSYFFGVKSNHFKIDRGELSAWGNESNVEKIDFGQEQAIENILFSEVKYSPVEKVNITMGASLSQFAILGPGENLLYESSNSFAKETIIDTVSYDGTQVMKKYNYPDYRISCSFDLTDKDKIKLAFNHINQNIFQLSNSYAVSPTDQWKLVDNYIKPASSNQVNVGYYRFIPALGTNFTIEGYYKISDNIPDFIDGASVYKTPNVEQIILQGLQEAKGVEVLVSKDFGRLNGWVSYAYSNVVMKFDGSINKEQINGGKPYLGNNDKPHVLNIVANFQFSKRVSLSTNLCYSTGRPITLPKSVYYQGNMPFLEYSDRNAYRVPDYFRTDMALTIEGNLKKEKKVHSSWVFSVYNLTGRENPYSIYFKNYGGIINGYQYSVIGVPVITVALNLKLGNYANE